MQKLQHMQLYFTPSFQTHLQKSVFKLYIGKYWEKAVVDTFTSVLSKTGCKNIFWVINHNTTVFFIGR